MQYTQQNFPGLALGALLVFALVFFANAAFSAGAADRGKPDPILTGAMDGPCDPALAHQVASANIENAPVPMQGQILVPLKGPKGSRPSYVAVDGKKLDPLLNPKPACR